MAYKAVNWDRHEDEYTQDFWNQNVMQFWLDKDIPVSDDRLVWHGLSTEERYVYSRVLGGLTALDTKQYDAGMPIISLLTEKAQRKSVLNFMGAMEAIHAKSYSSIFTTLLSREEIDSVFEWTEINPLLQRKIRIIDDYYQRALKDFIRDGKTNLASYYKAMAASVLLESYLFYSGFFYPLYLAGQGKMTSSGEIIGLIIRDESIHGLLVGMYAQEALNALPEKNQTKLINEVYDMVNMLHENELAYAQELYDLIGITDEVIKFTEYNANKALMNLGLTAAFKTTEEDINPIILNGINTATVNHDFFSVKGNSYIMALNVEKLTDEHFQFEIVDEFGDH